MTSSIIGVKSISTTNNDSTECASEARGGGGGVALKGKRRTRGDALPISCAACEIFATLYNFLKEVKVRDQFSVSMRSNRNRGVLMGIAALVLVLLLPFGVGFVLNRLDVGKKTRRFG
jgi:hypothetical protein